MKILSLNIEGRLHLEERVLPFLQQQEADVVCLQEVFKDDVPKLKPILGEQTFFTTLADESILNQYSKQGHGLSGQLIATALPTRGLQHRYYAGEPTPPWPEMHHPTDMCRALSFLDVQAADGNWYTVANTHFTWSADGLFTEMQQRDFEKMWPIIESLGSCIVCGDFNSPRQAEPNNVFNQLAERLKDNIPQELSSTLDPELHRAKVDLVVDGFFTTPEYQVLEIEVFTGISDHRAVVAEVKKA